MDLTESAAEHDIDIACIQEHRLKKVNLNEIKENDYVIFIKYEVKCLWSIPQ